MHNVSPSLPFRSGRSGNVQERTLLLFFLQKVMQPIQINIKQKHFGQAFLGVYRSIAEFHLLPITFGC